MKRLLKAAVLLAAPFALLMGLVDLRASRVHWNQYSAKRDLLKPQLARTEIAVFGSSHAYYGILPRCFDRPAFNFAGTGQPLYYDHALLLKYLDAMPNLKLVILPVSYVSLKFQLDESAERWRCCYYKYEYGLPHRDWHMRFSIRNFSPFFLCDNTRMRKDLALGRVRDTLNDYDSWGGWTNRQEAVASMSGPDFENHLRTSARTALQRHETGVKEQNIAENTKTIEDCIQRLRAKGVRVVLITMPVTHYYVDAVNPELYRRMQDIVGRIARELKVDYRNYMADPRFVDAEFEDGDHLNLAGAEKFTRILNEDFVAGKVAPSSKVASNSR